MEISQTEFQTQCWKKELSNQQSALSYNDFDSPEYFSIASQLIQIAEDLKLSESDSSYDYSDDELNETIDALMPEDFDFDKNNEPGSAPFSLHLK